MRRLFPHLLLRLLVAPAFVLLAACPSASTPPGPAPIDAPAPADDLAEPEDGFWEKGEAGAWRYDLGVGFVGEVQLTSPGSGRGLVRVTLPEGAAKGRLAALTVKYVRGSDGMGEDPAAASGRARWHVHADAGGRPGARLSTIEVDVDGQRAVPIDHEYQDGDAGRFDFEGTRHAPAAPVEVPATFWLVFERVSGDPRIGGMWLTDGNGLLGTYTNLYFLETPDAPLGAPKNIRPLLALDFVSLSR